MTVFEQLVNATPSDAADIERLLPQLSSTPHSFSFDDLSAMLSQPLVAVYVARSDNHIVGIATIVGYRIPTGEKWQLEDVVLDESMRGQGLARRMLTWAIDDFASHHHGAKIYLTSRPSRIAANALYVSLGFESKQTNNYVVRCP